MYTVASPDPNPRGGVNYLTLRVQFYANKCNEEEVLTPKGQTIIFLMGGGYTIFQRLGHSFFFNFSLSKQFFLKSLSGRQFILSIY